MAKKQKFVCSDREEELLTKYNLTLNAYEALEQAQLYKCKICGKRKEDTRYGVLDVDHDHASGRIRGLLCNECNRGLGYFKDNPLFMLRGIQYLKGNL